MQIKLIVVVVVVVVGNECIDWDIAI